MAKQKFLILLTILIASSICANPYFVAVSADQDQIKLKWVEPDLSDRIGNDNDIEENQAFPPPSMEELNGTNVDGLCPCNFVLVSSLGDAEHIQLQSMGRYTRYSTYNDRDSYRADDGGNYLYFLKSGWLVGPKVGSNSGYIHNSQQYACPYLIPGGWMYVNNGYWYNDTTLVVRCI